MAARPSRSDFVRPGLPNPGPNGDLTITVPRFERNLSLLRLLLAIVLSVGMLLLVAEAGVGMGWPTLHALPAGQPAAPHPDSPSRPVVSPATVTDLDKWALWTNGSRLRGANIYQRRVYPELDGNFLGPGPVGPTYSQADLAQLAAWGANWVNISHPGLFTETPPYVLDQAIQNHLDNLLDMIAAADMFAVISVRTGPGRSEFTFFADEVGTWFDESYLNDQVWVEQAAQDAWVAMWRHIAERYRDNPIVIGYNLMVEPNSNEVWLNLWDPEAFYANYGGTLYDWNQLYPRITAAIREVDANTPILIGGMAYSRVDWLPYVQPTGDPHTVYAVDQYAPGKYTHQDANVQDCTYPGTCDVDWDNEDETFDRAWLDGLLGIIDTFKATHGVPVAAAEFGVVRWSPGAAEFMDDQMNLFEQRGMNHAVWSWDPSLEPYASTIDLFNFRHGPDPDNHTDVESSALMDVIREHWGRNTVRPSADACLSDANRNGRVDVADIMATSQMPACPVSYYLPLLAGSWHQPWPP